MIIQPRLFVTAKANFSTDAALLPTIRRESSGRERAHAGISDGMLYCTAPTVAHTGHVAETKNDRTARRTVLSPRALYCAVATLPRISLTLSSRREAEHRPDQAYYGSPALAMNGHSIRGWFHRRFGQASCGMIAACRAGGWARIRDRPNSRARERILERRERPGLSRGRSLYHRFQKGRRVAEFFGWAK